MARVAIYPGSFDPVTYGHLDLIKRATRIFDEVIVAVAHNSHKKSLFTLPERLLLLKECTRGIRNIRVEAFEGLVVEYARRKKINCLIRGLRMISDFEYELQMALTNRRLSEEIETVFLMPSESYFYLTSRLIKEIATLKGDIRDHVPPFVVKKLQERIALSVKRF